MRGAFVHSPSCSQVIHDQQSAARRRQGSDLAHLVLETATVIDDLAPHLSGFDAVEPEEDRALPVHEGIAHQLADDQLQIAQNASIQYPGEPLELAPRDGGGRWIAGQSDVDVDAPPRHGHGPTLPGAKAVASGRRLLMRQEATRLSSVNYGVASVLDCAKHGAAGEP